jgi:hypothetical protein
VATPAQIIARERERLMALPGVVGVGLGLHAGKLAIVIMTEKLSKTAEARLPRRIDGIPVVVERTGPIVAH